MGFINIMKSQKDPDGIEGHKERERFQEQANSFPKKRKFIGGNKRKPEWDLFNQSQADLDKKFLKQTCVFYKMGCNLGSCRQCKKKERNTMAMNQQKPVAGEIDPEYQNGAQYVPCGSYQNQASYSVKGSNQRPHIADIWLAESGNGSQLLFYVNGIYRSMTSSGICPLEKESSVFDWTGAIVDLI